MALRAGSRNERGPAASEQRQAPPARERVHPALDARAYLVVLGLDVGVVVGPIGIAVERDRVLEGGPDLGREGDLREQGGGYAPRRLQRNREHLDPRDAGE